MRFNLYLPDKLHNSFVQAGNANGLTNLSQIMRYYAIKGINFEESLKKNPYGSTFVREIVLEKPVKKTEKKTKTK